jgi:hypothetical protein
VNVSQADQWQEWAIAAQGGDKSAYNALLTELAPYIKNVIINKFVNVVGRHQNVTSSWCRWT